MPQKKAKVKKTKPGATVVIFPSAGYAFAIDQMEYWRQFYQVIHAGSIAKVTEADISAGATVLQSMCTILGRNLKNAMKLYKSDGKMDLAISIKLGNTSGVEECRVGCSWSEKHKDKIETVVPDPRQVELPFKTPSDKDDEPKLNEPATE